MDIIEQDQGEVDRPAADYDVVVVGGGAAGLSAALWAARYRHSVLLVDSGEQRNRAVAESHGYFGFDGISPDTLIERARADLKRYPSVEVRHRARVTSTSRDRSGFAVTVVASPVDTHDRTGREVTVTAARLVIATGVRDVFPEVENFFDHYGLSVFTCPSCDGYESEGKDVVVIGHGEQVAGFALELLDWARSITVVTNGRPFEGDDQRRAALARHGIDLVEEKISRFGGEPGALRSVVMSDGVERPADVVFFSIGHEPRHELFRELGCRITEEDTVEVDSDNQTTVEGVYAAGDVSPGPHLIQVAAADGAIAGVAAAQSLRGRRSAAQSPAPAPDPEAECSEPDENATRTLTKTSSE